MALESGLEAEPVFVADAEERSTAESARAFATAVASIRDPIAKKLKGDRRKMGNKLTKNWPRVYSLEMNTP